MADLAPAIAAIVTGILGGLGAWWSARRAARFQRQGPSIARDTIDMLEAQRDVERDGRVTAETALARMRDETRVKDVLASQCEEALDDARSRIRTLERSASRRPRTTRTGL